MVQTHHQADMNQNRLFKTAHLMWAVLPAKIYKKKVVREWTQKTQ